MAVQVWVGEKPENPNERRAIVALANGLERLDGLYIILANFNVGGRTIDLVIIKQDAIFIIELKHCDGKIFGGVNGPWYIESANGNRKRLNPGRKNPYNQVVSYYYSFINFLNEHRTELLSPHKAESINFRTCKRVIVIAPTVESGSSVELDWKVELKGLDELPTFLVTERSAEIELTDDEMITIPKLLHCTRWQEINDLLEGVMPAWHAVQTEKTPVSPAPPPDTETPAATTPILQRLRVTLRTGVGRLAATMSALTLILLVAFVLRPTRVVPLPIDQPVQSLISATSRAAGGSIGALGGGQQVPTCVWSGFQPVGKRWDTEVQNWISVGVDGIVADLAPEIVVTLEEVSYCNSEISLRWSVRNNSADTIDFPLHSDNITILDPLGNQYAIANTRSRPSAIRVEPGDVARGTAVVERPVSQSSPSLLVRIMTMPFGEASWLVSLEGN